MKYNMFAQLLPVEGVDIHAFMMENLRQLEDGQFGVDYVEDLNILIAFADGEMLKIVAPFLSPAGFTGFCYGTEEEVDNDEVDIDTYLDTCQQMAAVVVAAIKSRGGFNTIEVCGWVEE